MPDRRTQLTAPARSTLEWTHLGKLVQAKGVQTGPFGSQLHASDYTSSGVGVVMPQDLGENEIVGAAMARISRERASELSRHALLPGDIVYSRRGDVTRRAFVRPSDGELICGTGCLRVRVESSIADARFVSYAVGTPDAKAWIVRHAVGATMANLNTAILSALPLRLPGLSQQRAIAEVLGALDDKIAANRRVVDRADALRRAVWRNHAARADLVPLSSLACFVNGRPFTKDATGTGRVVVRIPELRTGPGASTVYNDIDVAEEHLARPGDLLMSWSGSLLAARWFREEAIVNQHIFKIIPIDDVPIWSLACALETRMDEFRSIAATKATTMGHIQRHHLDELVSWPDVDDTTDALGNALWKQSLAAEMENVRLAATRDELLPLLMSARITVKDAEQRLEGEL